MPDLFTLLRSGHLTLEGLLDDLRGDPAREGPGPDQRRRVARRLVAAASAHEAVEEIVMWPAVRRLVREGDHVADEGVDQEQVAKKVLNELERTSAGTEEFETLIHQVASNIRRHILYEENQVWPTLQAVLSPEESAQLGAEAAARVGRVPTRPHPLTPPDPRLLAAIGPVVGAIDRARDVVGGRWSGATSRPGRSAWR